MDKSSHGFAEGDLPRRKPGLFPRLGYVGVEEADLWAGGIDMRCPSEKTLRDLRHL
jgi:hypothetical protein